MRSDIHHLYEADDELHGRVERPDGEGDRLRETGGRACGGGLCGVSAAEAENVPPRPDARRDTRTAAFLKAPRSPAELAAFQDEMASRGLEALRSIQP